MRSTVLQYFTRYTACLGSIKQNTKQNTNAPEYLKEIIENLQNLDAKASSFIYTLEYKNTIFCV